MIEVTTLLSAGCSQASNAMARLQPPPTRLYDSTRLPLQSMLTPHHCTAFPPSFEAGRKSKSSTHSLSGRTVLNSRPTRTVQGLLFLPHVRKPDLRNPSEFFGVSPRVTSRGPSWLASSSASLSPNPSRPAALTAAAEAASLDSPVTAQEADDVSAASSAFESVDEGDPASSSEALLSVKERRRRRNQNRLQYLAPDAVQQRQQAAEDRIMDIMVPKRRTPRARKKAPASTAEAAAAEAGDQGTDNTGAGGSKTEKLEASAGGGVQGADAAGAVGSEEEKAAGSEDGVGRGLEAGEGEGPLLSGEGAEVGSMNSTVPEAAAEAEAGESEEEPVELDPIARLERLGVRWWGLSAVSSMEFEVQGAIETLFSERFPDNEVKIFVPYAPTKRASVKTLDGTGAKRIAPGAMYMRCVMNRTVYDGIREVEGLYGFVGHEEKMGRTKLVLPWSIPEQEILTLQQVAQRQQQVQEEAAQASREAARRRRAKAKADREAAAGNTPPMEFVPAQRSSSSSSKGGAASGSRDWSTGSARGGGSSAGAGPREPGVAQGQGAQASRRHASANTKAKTPAGTVLRRGSAVQIIKGAYANLEGKLLSLDRETGVTRVGITLLGRTVSMDMPLDSLQPLQQPPGGPPDDD